jgi:predicted ABC-type ATPase
LNSPNLAVERVAERVRNGGHSIPEATIHRRYREGLLNSFSVYRPLADLWTVYDNTDIGNLRLVAVGRGNSIDELVEPEVWKAMLEERQSGQ